MKGWVLSACAASMVLLTTPAVGAAADGGPVGRYIVLLEPGGSPTGVAAEHARAFGAQVQHVYRYALQGYAASVPVAAVAGLRGDPQVREVVADGVVRATGQLFGPGVNRIDGELSSAASGDGGGPPIDIDVAVLDGRVQASHPDLNVVGSVDCTGGRKPDPDDFHGTMVAGIIAAKDNDLGIVGIAPGARIWSVQVLKKNGFGTIANVLCGVDWLTGTRLDANPANDIEVANMSLAGPGDDDGNCGFTNRDVFHQGICASVDAGVVYAVAAGNSAEDVVDVSPASYDEVLNVTGLADFDGRPGAVNGPRCSDEDDTFANFSNFAGSADVTHTVSASAVCITSTTTGSSYRTGSGTSFAAPYVAGAVALCIANGACAGLDARQILAKIVHDAEVFNRVDPGYGFLGDPQHPVPDGIYGYLINVAGY